MKKLLVFLGVLALAVPFAAHGAQVASRAPYSLDQGSVLNTNLYYAGQMAGIYGNVNGDVVAVGGSIDIVGNVSGSVMAAGGSVNVSGNVGGSVRAAGGTVNVSGAVGGDLAVFGSAVNIAPTAVIKGDLLLGGNTANIQGKVLGGVKSGAREVTINNSVGGASDLNVEDLFLGPNAVLNGLTYHSYTEAKIDPSAQIHGPLNFDKKVSQPAAVPAWGLGALFAASAILKFLAMLGAGLVFVYALKKSSRSVSDASWSWMSLWRGFVFLVLTPIIALILAITVIGLPLAGLVFLSYLLALLISWVFAAILAGAWLQKWIWKKEALDWLTVLLGSVAVIILGLIPVLGWIVICLIFLTALGSATHHFRRAWGAER